jgi:hypothetical protein
VTEPLQQTRDPCQVHHSHNPRSHVNQIHHVWPVDDGGPDVPENRIPVCATGHHNIHDLLDEYRAATEGKVPHEVLRTYSRRERELAALGWKRITERQM